MREGPSPWPGPGPRAEASLWLALLLSACQRLPLHLAKWGGLLQPRLPFSRSRAEACDFLSRPPPEMREFLLVSGGEGRGDALFLVTHLALLSPKGQHELRDRLPGVPAAQLGR